MKSLIKLCAPFLIAAIAIPAFAASANTDASRTFEKSVPAAGLATLKLHNAVGSVHITASDTNTIQIHATAEPGNHGHFIFDWTWGNQTTGKLPKDLRLVTKRMGNTLLICLVSRQKNGCNFETESSEAGSASGGSDRNHTIITGPGGEHTIEIGGAHHRGWKADWTVTIPARLALVLKVGVGHATVKGVAGGFKSDIGVGHLNAELPRGPVDAEVGVGHIQADIAAADYGTVKLTAGVGHASFEVNGEEIKTGYQHNFTSSEQTVTGSGTTAYTLKTGVGHVELNLGVSGMDFSAPASTSVRPATTSPSTSHAR